MKSFINLFAQILVLIIFLQFNIQAQTIQSEIKYLALGADIILTGKVVNQNSNWNHDKTRISTQSTIEVDELLKGDISNNKIVVTTPGGEVGEVGELYTHMPKFSNEEEVLVFVKQDKKDMSYKVLNGEDGKLTLYRDKVTGENVTSFNKKISSLKKEIKNYVEKQ